MKTRTSLSVLVLLVVFFSFFVIAQQMMKTADSTASLDWVLSSPILYTTKLDTLKTKFSRLSNGRGNFGAYGVTGHYAGAQLIRIDYYCSFSDYPAVPDSMSISTKFNGGVDNAKLLSLDLAVYDSAKTSWYSFANNHLIIPDSTNWSRFVWNTTPVKSPGVNWHGIKKMGKVVFSFYAQLSDTIPTYTGFDTETADFTFIDSLGAHIKDFDLLATGVEGVSEQVQIPKEFVLGQNYPNPFNPSTTIRFAVPEKGQVKLVVYNSLGQELKTLVSGEKSQGIYEVTFNASNLPSGIYFYRLQTKATTVETKKMLFLK